MGVFQGKGIKGYYGCISEISSIFGLPRETIHSGVVSAKIQRSREQKSELPDWTKVEFNVQPDGFTVRFTPLEPYLDDFLIHFSINNGVVMLN